MCVEVKTLLAQAWKATPDWNAAWQGKSGVAWNDESMNDIFSTDFHFKGQTWTAHDCTDTLPSRKMIALECRGVALSKIQGIQGTSEDDGSRDEELSFTTVTSAIGLKSPALMRSKKCYRFRCHPLGRACWHVLRAKTCDNLPAKL